MNHGVFFSFNWMVPRSCLLILLVDRLQDAELEARAAALRRGVNAGLRPGGFPWPWPTPVWMCCMIVSEIPLPRELVIIFKNAAMLLTPSDSETSSDANTSSTSM